MIDITNAVLEAIEPALKTQIEASIEVLKNESIANSPVLTGELKSKYISYAAEGLWAREWKDLGPNQNPFVTLYNKARHSVFQEYGYKSVEGKHFMRAAFLSKAINEAINCENVTKSEIDKLNSKNIKVEIR